MKTGREGGERERERSLPWGEEEEEGRKEKGRDPSPGINTAGQLL